MSRVTVRDIIGRMKHVLQLALSLLLLGFARPAGASSVGNAAVGVATGVVASGLGRGAFTLGGGGSYALKLFDAIPVVLRGSVAATGFTGGDPGGFARGEAAIGGRVSETVWLDAGVGADVLSYRTCGGSNCGRINGVVPSASGRFVWFNGWLGDGAGIAVEAGGFLVLRSDVHEGLTFTATVGPTWAFGGK